MKQQFFVLPTLVLALLMMNGCAKVPPQTLQIAQQGSFAVGGTVVTSPGVFDAGAQAPAGPPASAAGQTLHGDHASVTFQVPVHARRLPMVMWHGIGQFSKTWETTPDGREGYQTIFLRRGFGAYVVDQPRRGRAGRSTGRRHDTSDARRAELVWHLQTRHLAGLLPRRAVLARSGGPQPVPPPDDTERRANRRIGERGGVAALFNKIGPGILVTHSHSGGMGWRTAVGARTCARSCRMNPGAVSCFRKARFRRR